MATCKGCQATVRWALTTPGRQRMPMDPDPVEGGNVITVGKEGPFDVVQVVAPGEGTHVSHWATCTNPPARKAKK